MRATDGHDRARDLDARSMRAARWWGPHDVRVEAAPMPEPRPDEALIRVSLTGLCGSDLEEFESGPIVVRPGTIVGHEIVGEVACAAADGSGPAVGTPVVVDVVVGCGRCFWCRRDEEGQCPSLVVLGQTRDGGLAEFVAARADRLVPIPAGLDPARAALAEPLAVAVRAVRRAGVAGGSSIVIYGGGTIGMLTAQVARDAGAGVVVVVEPDAARRELVERWGARSCWHPGAPDRAAALATLLPERGADAVIECSGRPGVAREAIRVTRAGGCCVLVGVPIEEERVDLLDVVLGEKSVFGSAAHRWDLDVAVAVELLASARVEVSRMVTHVVPLEAAASAFETLADPGSAVIKLLVDCRDGSAGSAPTS